MSYSIMRASKEGIAMDYNEIEANAVVELRRGTMTLAVLCLLGEPRYGYSILQLLEEKHVQIDAGTLYPLLRRLEAQGVLESRWDTEQSRPRKYYVLNENGLRLREALKNEWRRLSGEISEII